MVIASRGGACSPAMNSPRCWGGRALVPRQRMRKLGILQRAGHLHFDVAAARQRRDGAGDEVEQQLGLVLAHVAGLGLPDEVVLALADEAARDLLGGAEIDHRSGRAGGTEREAAELQAGGGLLGDVADDVEGVVLRLLVVVLVEDLETIVDGADRADHVVADFAGDECSEFKVRRIGTLAHRCPLMMSQDPNEGAAAKVPDKNWDARQERTRAACEVFLPSDTRAGHPMQRSVARCSSRVCEARAAATRATALPTQVPASESRYERQMKLEEYIPLVEALLPAVLTAGRIEMAHFAAGVTVETKADTTPVTIADHEAEAVLTEGLHRAAPGVPVIAEEAVAAGRVPDDRRCVLSRRSARWDTRLHQGQPGVHHQHRARRRRQAGVRHHLCAGTRSILSQPLAPPNPIEATIPVRGAGRRSCRLRAHAPRNARSPIPKRSLLSPAARTPRRAPTRFCSGCRSWKSAGRVLR